MKTATLTGQLFFDWFSIVFVLIIVSCATIGVLRGARKTLIHLIIVAIAAVGAFYLCKPLVEGLENGTNWDEGLSSWIYGSIVGSTAEAGTEVPAFTLTESLFRSYISLPDFLWNPFYAVLRTFVPSNALETVAPATPIAETMTRLIFMAGAFGLLFLLIGGAGFTISGIVERLRKRVDRKKPSILSRVVGGVLGLAVAVIAVYCLSLGVDLLGAAQEPGSLDLAQYLHLGEDGYWSLAKWLGDQSFLYDQLLQYFGYFVR